MPGRGIRPQGARSEVARMPARANASSTSGRYWPAPQQHGHPVERDAALRFPPHQPGDLDALAALPRSGEQEARRRRAAPPDAVPGRTAGAGTRRQRAVRGLLELAPRHCRARARCARRPRTRAHREHSGRTAARWKRSSAATAAADRRAARAVPRAAIPPSRRQAEHLGAVRQPGPPQLGIVRIEDGVPDPRRAARRPDELPGAVRESARGSPGCWATASNFPSRPRSWWMTRAHSASTPRGETGDKPRSRRACAATAAASLRG